MDEINFFKIHDKFFIQNLFFLSLTYSHLLNHSITHKCVRKWVRKKVLEPELGIEWVGRVRKKQFYIYVSRPDKNWTFLLKVLIAQGMVKIVLAMAPARYFTEDDMSDFNSRRGCVVYRCRSPDGQNHIGAMFFRWRNCQVEQNLMDFVNAVSGSMEDIVGVEIGEIELW